VTLVLKASRSAWAAAARSQAGATATVTIHRVDRPGKLWGCPWRRPMPRRQKHDLESQASAHLRRQGRVLSRCPGQLPRRVAQAIPADMYCKAIDAPAHSQAQIVVRERSGLLLLLAQCDRYSISSPRTVPPNCADFNASRGNGHVPRSRRECEHLPRQAGRVPPICGSGRSGAVAGRAT